MDKSYLVPAVIEVFDILELLQLENGPLSLEYIYQQIKAPRTTVFRILKTCVHRGCVTFGPDGLYRISPQPRKLCFGFAAQSSEMPFSEIVTQGLKASALRNGVDLLVLDNQYNAEIAVRNGANDSFKASHCGLFGPCYLLPRNGNPR